MVEFALAGVASIFLLISTFHLAMGMWNYHTTAYAVHEATRFIAVKGRGCTLPGNNCTATVGTLAQKIKSVGIGVPSDQVVVTLTTDSGAVTTCSPLSSCFTNTTVWPPSANSDNKVGKKVTISAKYRFTSPMLIFWPGNGTTKIGQAWFPATSTQKIIF
jgi:hypothetical protein